MAARKNRQPSPEENRIINAHLAGILEDLNKAGIFCDGVLAFVTLDNDAYNLSTMMGVEVAEDVEDASEALIQYAHDELCEHIAVHGSDDDDDEDDDDDDDEDKPSIPAHARLRPVEVAAVSESMGWRNRLETIRGIPRDGAERVAISVKMLEDVILALDHMKKLEEGIRECESDGGCRASKFVKEERQKNPLAN